MMLLLGACASQETPEQVILDPALSGIVQIESHRESREGDLLRVKVTGRNTLDRVLLMNYQFDWLDEDGQKVDSVMAGKTRFSADRLRYFTLDGIAPSPEVVDYRLYIEERDR
ncbi:MAG: YcfL family protein [Oleiphilaceae bacterium]|nr:YcfL family protein [Oleiphilaceae bacterium]